MSTDNYKEFLTTLLIKKAMKTNKAWRFRQWHSKVFWLIKFGFYQDPTRLKFGIGSDWSEQPVITEFHILFWTLEIHVYKNKKQIY